MQIAFTQYLRPNGRKSEQLTEVSEEVGNKAKKLLEGGCRLECEVLMNEKISLTCEVTEDGENNVVCIKVCNNGPEVVTNIDELINTSYDRFILKIGQEVS